MNPNIVQVARGRCRPSPGATVDVRQCDALGRYSDAETGGTAGRKFLRGHQITNSVGGVTFITVLPGWYAGRAVHLHVKVRTTGTDGNPYEFTSQLCFAEKFKAAYLATAAKGTPDATNETDFLYGEGGDQLHLKPRRAGKGYQATFTIGPDLSDTAVGAPDTFDSSTAPPAVRSSSRMGPPGAWLTPVP
jgi:hypothetical protein